MVSEASYLDAFHNGLCCNPSFRNCSLGVNAVYARAAVAKSDQGERYE